MRKVLSVLLCIAILLPCICVGVSAEESDTFYKINIDAGDGAIGEKAIVKDGEIYIPATSFSNYTRFSFDTELKTFLIKGQDFKKAFKYVIIDINKKRVSIRGKKFIDLSDCFEIEGELYLPLCQMLPILNADIYEVKDNVIYISNNKLSLAEVLYDFDISDYYFNISAEFFDDNAMALLTIVPAFVFDSVTNGRFNRLDIIHNSGEYEDYKDAFSEFLADDNLYLKAMAQDASAIDSTVEFFNKANSTAKDMKSVYGWVEAAGKSEISAETGGVLFESLKAYYDSGDLKTDDLKGINDAWTGGKISFGDCIEILSYVYTYATQTEDNRQMLNSVYNVDSKISKKETARKAAKHVYDLYGDNIVPALYKEIATTVASDTLKDLSPIGVYTATAKVAGMVLETFMPFSPGEVAKLPTYSNIALSASSKYRSYDTSTDESTQNLRLSLLLCMIASKKCYEVMDDVFEKDGLSYYEDQIKDIEQLIMALYIVEENTDFDSFEHFEEYRKDNLKAITDSKLLDNLEEYPKLEEHNYIPSELQIEVPHIASEYFPYIKFNEDFSCNIKFNMLEWIENCEGTYEVFLTSENKRIIKVHTGSKKFGDANTNVLKHFYLIENDAKNWVYFGEYTGKHQTGKEFVDCGDKQIVITELNKLPTVSNAIGEYTSLDGEPLDTLTISDITEDGKVSFDAEWYRATGMRSVQAHIVGCLAFFKYTNEGYYETYGVLDFSKDNEIKMTLFETKLPYITKGIYNYKFVSKKDMAQNFDGQCLSYLLLNSSKKGWVKGNLVEATTESDMFMFFSNDGDMVYWNYTDTKDETPYRCKYRLEDQVLYINNCAYDITHMESTGSTTLSIQAKENYNVDFSGRYELAENNAYSYLFSIYEKTLQNQNIEFAKKVFQNCYMNPTSMQTNDNIKTGKYEGFWVGLESGYSYITFRDDQTFLMETNVDHTNRKIITPVSFEGKYIVFGRDVSQKNDSNTYSKAVILYVDGYLLAWYEAEGDYLSDQSSGYSYIGE